MYTIHLIIRNEQEVYQIRWKNMIFAERSSLEAALAYKEAAENNDGEE